MSEDETRLSRRKLLGGLTVAGLGTVAGGAGTYAFLKDTKNSKLILESGSVLLEIEPSEFSFAQDDGDEMSKTVTITNKGTLPASQLRLTGLGASGDNQIMKACEVTSLDYRGTDILSGIKEYAGDPNGNGILDLDDIQTYLSNNPIPLEAAVSEDGLNPGESADLTMSILLDYSQIEKNGQQFTMSLKFKAMQQNLEDTELANQTVWADYNSTTTNTSG